MILPGKSCTKNRHSHTVVNDDKQKEGRRKRRMDDCEKFPAAEFPRPAFI